MKKVYLQSYCKNNVGDDMFILTLAKRFKNINFHLVVEKEHRKVFENQENITILDSFDEHGIKGRLKLRFCYKALIKLGGSIFMEPKNWEKRPPFPKWQCRLLNKNKFVIGANFGPYYTKEYFDRAKGTLEYYQSLCFRDKYSYNLFSDLKNCIYAPDILFGYEAYPAFQKGEGVGISLIKLEERDFISGFAEKYYSSLALVCKNLCEKNIKVTLFSFCKSEGDEYAIEKVLSKSDQNIKQKICICNYDGNIQDFLHRFNSCEYIVATRFHSLVFGLALKKKVYPIIYSQKLLFLLKDISFFEGQNNFWNILQKEQKNEKNLTEEILSNRPVYLSQDFLNSSKKHFEPFSKYIK